MHVPNQIEEYSSNDEDSSDNEEHFKNSQPKPGQLKRKKKSVSGSKPGKRVHSETGAVVKMPSAEEMRFFQETVTHYPSMLFRLQMKEMLNNISGSEDKFPLHTWEKKFSSFLMNLPAASEPVELMGSKKYRPKGIKPPFPLPKLEGRFLFAPPTRVTFVGSYNSGTVTHIDSVYTLDMMLVVPKSCLSKKDHNNGAWLVKRALYLMHLAASLSSCDVIHSADLCWTQHMGEPLRPALLVRPVCSSSQQWRVQLLPVPDAGTFKPHAFAPHRHNIKLKGVDDCGRANFLSGVDAAMAEHSRELQEAFTALPELQHGAQLVKTWLRQRQLSVGRGGMSGHVVSMLVLYLHRKRLLNIQMSGYEVFKATINYIATEGRSWSSNGPSLYIDSNTVVDAVSTVTPKRRRRRAATGIVNSDNTVPTVDRLHQLCSLVFLDSTGYVNLADTIHTNIMEQICTEAAQAQRLLSTGDASNSFEDLFIRKTSFDFTFDQSLRVQLNSEALTQFYSEDKPQTAPLLLNQLHPSMFGDNPSKVSSAVGEAYSMTSEICSLLQRGLDKRATLIAPQLQPAQQWPVSERRPADQHTTVRIGLRLDPASAWMHLTKDNSGSDGCEFRALWGELSTLRRFQDGSVCEAVAWTKGTEGLGDRRAIPGDMCRQLLLRHLGITFSCVYHFGPDIERTLRLPKLHPQYKQYSTGEECSVAAVVAYDELCRVVRSMDLGLAVTHFASSSPALAQAEIFPLPLTSDDDPYMTQLKKTTVADYTKVLVFLERSGKWPAKLAGVEIVREEFHRVVCKGFSKERVAANVDGDFVNAVLHGFAFRLRVTYQGEVMLLRRAGEQQTLVTVDEQEETDAPSDTPQSLQLQVDTVIAPTIVSALKGVVGGHSSYGGCVRLCRRWLRSQLMEPLIPALATQLLVAQLYLQPDRFQVPSTPYVGFLRFLDLVSKRTDFMEQPFFVDLNNSFSKEDIQELQSRFKSARETFPALSVITPYDIRGDPGKLADVGGVANIDPDVLTYRYALVSECTRSRPTMCDLSMLQELAQRAMEAHVQHTTAPDHLALFAAPLSLLVSHVTVHLNPVHLPCPEQSLTLPYVPQHKIKRVSRTTTHGSVSSLTSCVWRPEQIVVAINEYFKDEALVLYDQCAGDVISITFSVEDAFREKPLSRNSPSAVFYAVTSTQPPMIELDLGHVALWLQDTFKPLVKFVTVQHQ